MLINALELLLLSKNTAVDTQHQCYASMAQPQDSSNHKNSRKHINSFKNLAGNDLSKFNNRFDKNLSPQLNANVSIHSNIKFLKIYREIRI